MGLMAPKDTVSAARKALEAAESEAERAARREKAASERAEAFAVEAAGIDPDADEKAFARATRELADLRAAAELHRSRAAASAAKVEAARASVVAVENADRRARLAAVAEEIKGRETQALLRFRAAAEALGAEVVAVRGLVAEGNQLAEQLRRGGVMDARMPWSRTAGMAGAAPARLAELVADLI